MTEICISTELTASPINEQFNPLEVGCAAICAPTGSRETCNVIAFQPFRDEENDRERPMNGARHKGGLRPVAIRPEIPKSDYLDEISDEQFAKLRDAVKDLNSKDHKRTRISGFDWPLVD